MRCKCFSVAVFLTLFALLGSAHRGLAFDKHAHVVGARIAYSLMSESARAECVALLRDSPHAVGQASDEMIFAIHAEYPDVLRQTPEGRMKAPWHYSNSRLHHTDFDMSREDPANADKGGAVTKLKELLGVLHDKTRPRSERVQALYWVMHLVGDVHQPLHIRSNDDRGGNEVKIRWPWSKRATESPRVPQETNLHAIWDKELLKAGVRAKSPNVATNAISEWDWTAAEGQELFAILSVGTEELAASIKAEFEGQSFPPVEKWVRESFDLAPQAYRIGGEGSRQLVSGDFIPDEYIEKNSELALKRVVLSGLRLGYSLNWAFSE